MRIKYTGIKQLIHSHPANTYVNLFVDEKEQWYSGVEFS
jgi:hypothetical protein